MNQSPIVLQFIELRAPHSLARVVMDADDAPSTRDTTSDALYVIDEDAQRSLAVQKPWARNPHHFKRCAAVDRIENGRATRRRDASDSSTDADPDACVTVCTG